MYTWHALPFKYYFLLLLLFWLFVKVMVQVLVKGEQLQASSMKITYMARNVHCGMCISIKLWGLLSLD